MDTLTRSLTPVASAGTWVPEGDKPTPFPGFSGQVGEDFADRLHRSVPPAERAATDAVGREALQSGRDHYSQEFRCLGTDGQEHRLHEDVALRPLAPGRVEELLLVSRDITERKRVEHERETMTRLLELLNAPGDLHELLRRVTALIREAFACEAVGIRLREGDDFPYFETRGFPAQFVEAETRLCQRDALGQPVRDSAGHPVLDCMCGNVLHGRFEPQQPFFTARGSFWSNCTTELLATTSETDRQARTRNRCHGEGYESVGLFALRTGGVTYGLLQVNDRRRGRFTGEGLALLERLADSLAISLAHRLSVAERETLARQRQLALGAARLGWWRYDPITRIASWDDGYRRIFGISGYTRPNDEILARIIHPDDLPALWAKVADALRASETRHRLLFETSRDALMTLAPPSWKFTTGNPATIAMFGARDEADSTALRA